MDLSFNHCEIGRQLPRGCDGLLYTGSDEADRDRYAIFLQNLFALVFVDLHADIVVLRAARKHV
jgi:hypothetical protein